MWEVTASHVQSVEKKASTREDGAEGLHAVKDQGFLGAGDCGSQREGADEGRRCWVSQFLGWELSHAQPRATLEEYMEPQQQ